MDGSGWRSCHAGVSGSLILYRGPTGEIGLPLDYYNLNIPI